MANSTLDFSSIHPRQSEHNERSNPEDHDIPWRQFAIPEVGLWQLFAKDPNGVLIELNFTVAKEPEGSAGPGSDQKYLPGEF